MAKSLKLFQFVMHCAKWFMHIFPIQLKLGSIKDPIYVPISLDGKIEICYNLGPKEPEREIDCKPVGHNNFCFKIKFDNGKFRT